MIRYQMSLMNLFWRSIIQKEIIVRILKVRRISIKEIIQSNLIVEIEIIQLM